MKTITFRRASICVLIAGLSLLFADPLAALENLEMSGSVRNLSQLAESSVLLDEELFLSVSTLRLEVQQTFNPQIKAEAALENLWLYSNPSGIVPLSSDPPNTLLDLTKTWREGENWSSRLHIDRLNLRGRHDSIRWTAGRQAYGFGNILLFSPLDIVAPFAPDAIDTEYRPGVDALRVDLATATGNQFSSLVVFDSDSGQNSYLATGSLNHSGIDLLLIGGNLRSRSMGGAGLAGNLGGLGVKGELAWYAGKDVGSLGGDLHDDFPVAAAELWYRFENDLILLVEYLHNGAGSDEPAGYLKAATSAAFTEGLSTLLGQNYLLLAPSYEVHPLVSVSALGIWNLDDESYLVRPQFSLSLSDNLAIDLFYTFNRGTAPVAGPLPGLQIPQSEFGLYGDSAALYLRWYF